MRRIIAFLLLCLVANGALEQSYIQTVKSDGSSFIEKTTDLSPFSSQLNPGSFERMKDTCERISSIWCTAENETVIIREHFLQGGSYYTFTTEYGLPYITHTMVIRKIPTDKLSNDLDRLLAAANATSAQPSGTAKVLDLTENNSAAAEYLRMVGVNITYTVNMPAQIDEVTGNGTSSGSAVTFDLVELMEKRGTVTIQSRELNLAYITGVAAVVVLFGLALLFFSTAKRRKKD